MFFYSNSGYSARMARRARPAPRAPAPTCTCACTCTARAALCTHVTTSSSNLTLTRAHVRSSIARSYDCHAVVQALVAEMQSLRALRSLQVRGDVLGTPYSSSSPSTLALSSTRTHRVPRTCTCTHAHAHVRIHATHSGSARARAANPGHGALRIACMGVASPATWGRA